MRGRGKPWGGPWHSEGLQHRKLGGMIGGPDPARCIKSQLRRGRSSTPELVRKAEEAAKRHQRKCYWVIG